MLLLHGRKPFVALPDLCCFACVTHDCLVIADRFAVMHHPGAETQSPKRCSAEFIGGRLIEVFGLCGLWDAVPRAHVMQEKVAVGVDSLATDEEGHAVRAPLIGVPTGKVSYVVTWQTAHPISANNFSPA